MAGIRLFFQVGAHYDCTTESLNILSSQVFSRFEAPSIWSPPSSESYSMVSWPIQSDTVSKSEANKNNLATGSIEENNFFVYKKSLVFLKDYCTFFASNPEWKGMRYFGLHYFFTFQIPKGNISSRHVNL